MPSRRRRSRSRPRACCSRTSPACPPSSTSPRCATRSPTSAATPARINPLIPAELVIDHSVQVDAFASRLAFARNVELEFERNRERYAFLRWGQRAFRDFKVVPPGTGICHQVNLEFLARVVEDSRRRRVPGHARRHRLAHDDGERARRARLGRRRDRGRGGDARRAALDARAAGRRLQLTGALREGATATDLVLTVTEILRKTGVVGKFVEYFGDGLARCRSPTARRSGTCRRSTARRAASSRSTTQTLDYLRLTGRARRADRARRGLLQGEPALARPERRTRVLAGRRARPRRVEPSLAGPRRPQDRVPLSRAKESFLEALGTFGVDYRTAPRQGRRRHVPGQRPDDRAGARRRAAARAGASRSRRRAAAAARVAVMLDGEEVRARPRRGRHRRDHVLHEHVEPAGDGRRRPAREEGGRARPRAQAVGEDLPRARLEGRHRLLRARRPADRTSTSSASTPSATAARPASATPGRCRTRSRRRSPRATSSPARCSPATATSRRASTPR